MPRDLKELTGRDGVLIRVSKKLLGSKYQRLSTLASMIDWEATRAESVKQSLQMGNQSLRARDIIALVSHVALGYTN